MSKTRPIFQLLNPSSINNPRNTTNIWWLHSKHLFLPMIWHSCIHSITPCITFTSLVIYVSLCVCPSIDSNENNRFAFYQPYVYLDHWSHTQFVPCSNFAWAPSTISFYRHLEKEHFFCKHLSRKTIILNVIITFLNFKVKMLSIYPLLSKWCLNNVIKFIMLGEHNVVNLSITWCSLSPFKNSIGHSTSSLNKCLTRRFYLLPLPLLTS
jgi:hypothetical protein